VRIDDILAGKRVLVCAGAGGVGKTTSSAAIGAGMAARGHRVLVVTIDPARRLAGALGMPEVGDTPHRVDLPALGIDGEGELHAMMLDAKGTFDGLVREYAPSPEAGARILANRIYQQLSSAVAGSQEYMAMEKLYELHSTGEWDLVVLDTPPSRHAIDFLDAPARLIRFIEGKALRFLLHPGAGRFSLRSLGSGSAMVFSALERLTGFALLRDLSEFVAGFEGMYEGFRERAERVSALLASDETTFLLVTIPEEDPIAEAEHFWRSLVERDLPFGGVVVNKVHPDYLGAARRPADLEAAAAAGLRALAVPAGTAARAAENLLHYQALAARDRRNIDRLAGRLGREPLLEVPYLDHDVHDLPALVALSGYLFGARAGAPATH
jgi:anion-transporting  ArsA/GET3 family ATPase